MGSIKSKVFGETTLTEEEEAASHAKQTDSQDKHSTTSLHSSTISQNNLVEGDYLLIKKSPSPNSQSLNVEGIKKYFLSKKKGRDKQNEFDILFFVAFRTGRGQASAQDSAIHALRSDRSRWQF